MEPSRASIAKRFRHPVCCAAPAETFPFRFDSPNIHPAFIGQPVANRRCWPQNGNGSNGEGDRSRPRTGEEERDFVPIHSLLQHSAFGPEDIDRIVTAYEDTLRALPADGVQPAAETVAKAIIKIAQTGVRDPARIRRLALKELASSS
jgi:hypothetical protein